MSSQYQITNSKTVDACGTSLRGHVNATFDQLVEAFGEPTFENDDTSDKVNIEWALRIDGVTVTIYCWKVYGAYDPRTENDWHIGGFGGTPAVALVEDILNK